MKTAKQFAETAASCATWNGGTPPAVLLERILGNIKRIKSLVRVSPAERAEALSIAWNAYAKVLKRVDPELDESWGCAIRIGTSYSTPLDIINDEQLSSLVMYGETDYYEAEA